MSRGPLWCELCARLKDSNYDEEQDDTTYYCEAYPDGVPEAVFQAGHLYPKPGDNGLRFKPITEKVMKQFSYLQHSQKDEDADYRGYQEYYEEVNMSDFEFAEKMKREHGDDWYLYQKPERIDF